jgi:hypothetical protein
MDGVSLMKILKASPADQDKLSHCLSVPKKDFFLVAKM